MFSVGLGLGLIKEIFSQFIILVVFLKFIVVVFVCLFVFYGD